VLQSGSCRDVYRRPDSVKVGRLLGIDNLVEGAAGPEFPGGLAGDLPAGTRLLWQVPPEAVRVRRGESPSGAGRSAVDLGPGLVTDVIDLGRTVEVVLELASGVELRARTFELPDLSVGAACRVETEADAVSVWPQAEPDLPSPG
jgi:hypothetical protein